MPEVLMELPVGDGKHVLVEVDRVDVPDDLVLASARPGEVAARASEALESLLAKVDPSVQALADWAKRLAPDDFTVEFGLKLGGETGIVIAKGKSEVNFTVKLSWKSA